jgi:hypothetical protein
MCEFAGANRPDYVKIARKWSIEEERANWKGAEAKTDYRAAADRRSGLGDQIVPLAEAAGEFEATTMARTLFRAKLGSVLNLKSTVS